MLKQFKELGLYIPSFFFMKVATEESLANLENCSDQTKATFFHEYIHFLQDIYTLFGLRNINYTVNLVYQINQESLKSDEVRYPISIKDRSIAILGDLFNIYYGSTFSSYDTFKVLSFSFEPNNNIKGYEEIEYVNINTINFGGSSDSYYLGAYIIKESLAYLIEYSIFGKSSVPTFPYKIVDLIVDNLFPELNLDLKLKISLCEESLNSGHPGITFIELLNRIKKKNLSFKSVEELHNFCHLNYFLEDENKVKCSIPLALESETSKSQSNLKTYFPDEKIIKVNPWIDLTFEVVKEIRKSNLHFYKLAGNKNLAIEIINKLGTPLVANKNNFFFMNLKLDQSECDISLFLAIRELLLISLGKQIFCGLKSYCSMNNKDLINSNCDNIPQENRKRKKKCILAALMYMWGIK